MKTNSSFHKVFRSILFSVMLPFILGLFGCSSSQKNTVSSKETDELIRTSVDEFNNRTIYTELTREDINATEDDQLLQVVFDNLVEKLPNNHELEYETVMSFSKPRQAIFSIWVLEAEINNGGFNQFYANSSGQYAQHMPEALQSVGAQKFSVLMKKANEIYVNEHKKITEHMDGTIEGFSKSYEDNPLNELDKQFYKLYEVEDLQKLQVEFIRNNINEFIDK